MCLAGGREAGWPAECREKMMGSAAEDAIYPVPGPYGVLLICK